MSTEQRPTGELAPGFGEFTEETRRLVTENLQPGQNQKDQALLGKLLEVDEQEQ